MATIKIPKDWQWVKLGDECEFTQGIQVDIEKQKFEKFENSVQFLRIIDFTQVNEPPRYIENPGERYILNKNEIAMVRYGTVGFVCINKIGAIANNLFKINPSKNIYPKYLINFFNSLLFRSKLETKGATMQALSFGLIKPIPLPLPPLETQQAIVSKIEELFSELDKGIEDLKTAQQQLKTYRQSVLKWAFEGKLTNENVIDGELPRGWIEIEIKNICENIKVGIVIKPTNFYSKDNSGIKAFRSANVREFLINDSNWVYFTEESNEINYRTKLKEGDVLLVRSGYPGTSCVVSKKFEGCNAIDILIATPNKEKILPQYLCFFNNSPLGKGMFKDKSRGVAQKHLNVGEYSKLKINIPSLDEQHLIVQEIESRLSVADKMEESIAQSLQQAEALRQSILKKAFSGQLI